MTNAALPAIGCPLCQEPLRFSLASSRKAKKPKVFVMLACPRDGRHFRGFISDQGFVRRLVERTEGSLTATGTGIAGGSTPFVAREEVLIEQTERVH